MKYIIETPHFLLEENINFGEKRISVTRPSSRELLKIPQF